MYEKSRLNKMKSINDLLRHTQPIHKQLSDAVTRIMASGRFVLGPEVNTFENEFATYCGVTYCIMQANGTDTLEVGSRVLAICKGETMLTITNAGM